jgi:hypothetical protein
MARRLLVPVTVMFLVLLVLSSLGPSDQATRTDTSPATPGPPPGAEPARTVEVTVPAEDDVEANVGDLVTLTVRSDEVGGVELPDFGESEPVSPEAPAIFDVLPTEPGRFEVLSAETGEEIGALVVEEPT